MTQIAQDAFLEAIEEWLKACEDAFRFLESGDLQRAMQSLTRAHELGYLTTWFGDMQAFNC